MEILQVQPHDVDRFWNDCAPLLQKALDKGRGESSLMGLRQNLLNGQTQLWIVFEEEQKVIACGISTIIQYELKRVFRGLYLGGEKVEKWMKEMDSECEKYALLWGCKDIEWFGRKGWMKKTAPLGYSEGYTIMRREL